MTNEKIRAIAQQVANEMYGTENTEMAMRFATRFLAAITAKAEPVAEVHGDPDYVRTWQVCPIKRGSYKPGDKLFLHPAIEPVGEVVVTTTEEGRCVCVTRQDEEGRILKVIWEAPAIEPAQATNAKLRFALENCRLLAARHRKEDWALLILGFCSEGGVAGSPLRDGGSK